MSVNDLLLLFVPMVHFLVHDSSRLTMPFTCYCRDCLQGREEIARTCIIQRKVSATPDCPVEVTRLLRAWSSGEQAAFDQLAPVVYGELQRLARQRMARESPDHTLQPTALVNEAYLQLVNVQNVSWQDRAHFFAVCARMMRRILTDRARARGRAKRGGGAADVPLDDVPEIGSWRSSELVALDDALNRMEQMDPRKAAMIELRFYSGLSVEETAAVLKVSPQTILRDWKLARSWLERELRRTA